MYSHCEKCSHFGACAINHWALTFDTDGKTCDQFTAKQCNCRFCGGYSVGAMDAINDNGEICICNNQLVVFDFNTIDTIRFDIKYCPMCGRKLESEGDECE